MLFRHLSLKKQIRRLSRQVEQLAAGACEKMTDIALIDRDLERLSARINRLYAGQRRTVAAAWRHEEQLKESIANISHDLRTPLTVIMGHLQLLRKSPLSPEQQRRVDTALRRAERMKGLTEVFYELSVLDADQIQPCPEKINLSNFLIDFLAENAPLFERRKLCPQIRLSEESLFVISDRRFLERILQNLFANAASYSAGEIQIALYRSGEGNAVLQVDNTVKDADGLEVDRLFDRFFTGDRARGSGHTGLGLAVVKLLAGKLGGGVSASLESGVLSIRLTVGSMSCFDSRKGSA